MKRLSRVLLVMLSLAMIVPMVATLIPQDASAASSTPHVAYLNKFDFEDATVGSTLSDTYLNQTAADGFTTTPQSGVTSSASRKPSNYTVMSETVGEVTRKYISPTSQFAMPTIYDQTGITWQQPYELKFTIRGEKGAALKEVEEGETVDPSGYNYGALIASSSTITAAENTRFSLVYGRGLTINWAAGGGEPICTLVSNQWHEITAQVNPLTGVVKLRIEQLTFDENNTKMTKGSSGTASSDGTVITSTKTISALSTQAAKTNTAGLVSMGRFYGDVVVDYCFDEISLGSYVDEHIDFADAVINSYTETQTLPDYLAANGGGTTAGVIQFVDSANLDCYGLTQVGDEWYLHQNIAKTATIKNGGTATEAGITFKDATNLSGDEVLTIQFDFMKNSSGLANAYNAIRFYDQVNSDSKVSPLTFRQGNYITTGAAGYVALRKTDAGFVSAKMDKDTWYSFKAEIDLANATFKVWMNEGRVTDENGDLVWEPLYYISQEVNVAATNTTDGSTENITVKPTTGVTDKQYSETVTWATNFYNYVFDAETFSQYVTTTASFASYGGISPTAAPTLYMMYGTDNAWNSRVVDAYMDNLSIKTADGNVNVSMDFTPEITTVEQNVDWWEHDTFQNADAKKGGAKLSDWNVVDVTGTTPALLQEVFENGTYIETEEKVDEEGNPVTVDIDPDGTYGSVIKPSGTLGSFCFNDTQDILTNYVFDVSFDFFMLAQPSSNIHLLKLWAPYTATDAGRKADLSTLVIWGGQFMIASNSGNSRKDADVVVSAKVGQWYNIRVRFDLQNGQYMAYIDDQLIHTQNILEEYPDMDLDNLESLHFAIHNHWGSSVRAYHYLDNIKVRTVEPAVSLDTGARIVGVQKSTTSNSIRVIAGLDSLNYGNVGFTFELLAADGSGWIKVHDKMVQTVYTEITADGETVTAASLGCRYIIMAIITDIDTSGVLCARPYTTKKSVRNYGSEAIYSLRVDDGSLSMQKTEISTTSAEYNLYKYEGYEEANDTFSTYSATPSESDTNEYRLGGQMHTANGVFVGTTTDSVRTGEKAMLISGLEPDTSGNYSARIKLNNLLPYNISNYLNQDIKISAYVKVTDLCDGATSVPLRLGLMDDDGYDETVFKTFYVSENEWTLIEYEGRISDEFLGKIASGYPARVLIGFGTKSAHSANVYVDDVSVYFKPSVGIDLPSIFSDGMVLQRNKPVNVWGWEGLAGDSITATVTDKSGTVLSTADATVDSNGEFLVTLPQMAAATDCTLTVTNNSVGASVSYTDVGIGEVWFCSGQSNMQLTMSDLHNVEDIVADADNCNIRRFKVAHKAQYELQKDVSGSWSKITTENVTGASGIAYITAYQLQQELDVPVAIIECHLGSSSANAWLSYDKIFAADRAEIYNNPDWIPLNSAGTAPLTASSGGLEGKTMYEDYNYYWQIGTSSEGTLRDGEYGNKGSTFAPTALYNGMQGPLANYALAGVLWYQGESRTNSLRADEYNYILYDLVEQWREDFCDDELPVVIFQMAPYSDYYNLIRQSQLDTAKRLDHVYAITTAYEGGVFKAATGNVCLDPNSSGAIHPGTKRPVAERAAYAILVGEYGKSAEYAAYLNPEYQTITVSGNVATLTFSNADGLKIHDGDTALTGFRAYAADGTELTVVSAVIDGSTVVVTTSEGTSPAKITYAFDNSSVRREVRYEALLEKADPQYINVLTGNLENAMSQPTIPFVASLSDVSIYDASVSGGKLRVEIRELGHLCSTYKVIVSINGDETEYTASFVTAGNYVIDGVAVSEGDAVTVTLKTADGASVIESVTVE